MYAPSSYNETVTGETLSSVSEKSESYSNADSNPDYLVRKQVKRTFTTLHIYVRMLCSETVVMTLSMKDTRSLSSPI